MSIALKTGFRSFATLEVVANVGHIKPQDRDSLLMIKIVNFHSSPVGCLTSSLRNMHVFDVTKNYNDMATVP